MAVRPLRHPHSKHVFPQDANISEEISNVEELEVEEPEPNAKKTIKEENLSESYKKVVQDGYESLEKFETRVVLPQVTNDGRYIMPSSEKVVVEKLELRYETINKFKEQYQSGYETQAAVETLNGREKLELKDVSKPYKIKPEKYVSNIAYSSANGWNGNAKMQLIRETGANVNQKF